MTKAVMVSRRHMSFHDFDLKMAHYKDVAGQVKAFQRQVKKGLLTTQEVEEKGQLVFSLFADAMNDIQIWTGKASTLLPR